MEESDERREEAEAVVDDEDDDPSSDRAGDGGRSDGSGECWAGCRSRKVARTASWVVLVEERGGMRKAEREGGGAWRVEDTSCAGWSMGGKGGMWNESSCTMVIDCRHDSDGGGGETWRVTARLSSTERD